jgi:hypothetical protein
VRKAATITEGFMQLPFMEVRLRCGL